MAKVPMLKELKSKYDQDPHGRAFGALAEAYRKSGQIKKAIDLIKKHIADHRDYSLAYLTLARCYFEIKKSEEAFEILSPLLDSNRDNLGFQESYGDICESLGHVELALDCYKRVLFFKPKDRIIKNKVYALEEKISPVISSNSKLTSVEQWSQVDVINSSKDILSNNVDKADFMSYFDQKMESFDAELIDSLNFDLIKEEVSSDEGLLTELTINSNNTALPIRSEVSSPKSSNPKYNSLFSEKNTELTDLHSDFNDKVDMFLALLASKRSYKLAQAS